MRGTLWIAIAAVVVTAALDADGNPRSPEEALKTFALSDDLTIELVAAEPLIASPCAMAFDEHGRVFVAENRGYPRTSEPPQGSIALLEDTDGDGRMDKRTVFADGITYPNGVMPWKGGLIVTCAPDVLYLRDSDGDGRADERRVLLTGFATKGSTQLRVNAPLLGPDGWIWLASGLSGGTISNPEHPEFGTLELKSDLRFDPHSGRFEAVDGRTQYGHSFDELGRRFICMNRVQVQHVVLSSKHLRRNPHLAFSETVQNCPDLVPNLLMRGGGGAARIYPISENITTADSHAGTFSAACAVTIWEGGSALPPEYLQVAFSCDPTGNLIHADKLERRGATFAAVSMFKDREFLASRDNWFRPVFLAAGPDGALYVCDMYRKVIEHPDYLPGEIAKNTDFEAGKDMGRIWRIRAKAAERVNAAPMSTDVEGLVPLLPDENPWASATARRLLLERPRSADAALLDSPSSQKPGDPRSLLNKRLFTAVPDAELEAAVMHPVGESATAAVQILGEDIAAGRRDASLLLRIGEKPAETWPFDVLVYVVALGGVPDGTATTPLLVKAAQRCSPDDRWTAAAIVASSAGRELPLLMGLLSKLGDAPEVGTRNAPLLQLLAETLGRSQSVAKTNSIETILKAMRGTSYDLRASIAGAYAKGRQLPLAPEGLEVGTLLEETREILASNPTAASTIPVLAHASWESGGEPLLAFAAAGERTAFQALTRWDRPEIPERLLASASIGKATTQLREEILAVCFGRPSFFPAVLDALEAGVVPRAAITPQRRQLLLKSKDAMIRERAAKLFELPDGDRKAAFEKAKASLELPGMGAKGREIFTRACAICHRLDREGVAVGPDLFDIRNQPKESILLHIVVPEAEIAPGFAAYVAEMQDGRTLAGVLVSETGESITLRQAGGAEETILRATLKGLNPLPTSLMPAGMESGMSPQELADLLAYLRGEV